MPHKSKKRITPVVEEIVSENPTPVDTHHQPVKPPQDVVDEALAPAVTQSSAPSSPPRFSINLSFVGIVLVVAGFVALLTGGLYVYFNGVSSIRVSDASPTPEALSLATPIPTTPPSASSTPTTKPTPTPKLNEYKVSVLNGSGKIGEAGKVKLLIEKAGFKVTQTGNASAFNYTDTIIQAKSSIHADVVSKIRAALADTYSVKDGDVLDAKNTFDIIVTVGSK